MNRYKLSQAGINVREGIERFNNNQPLYERMLGSFLQDESFAMLQAALKENKAEDAFRAAHSMKGITGNLSMNTLYQALLPLVEELRAGSTEHARELMIPVTEAYEQVQNALRQ